MLGMALIFAQGANAQESQYVTFSGATCSVVESGRGQDYVLHRCRAPGQLTMWALFQDSNRWGLGFGSTPNFAVPGLALDQTGRPIELRGQRVSGAFRVTSIIIRCAPFFADDRRRDAGPLVVLRVAANGGVACVVGEVAIGARQNESARALADRADAACTEEPQILRLRRPTAERR
jgi:hypothetical protein